jgi:hypothetical protein
MYAIHAGKRAKEEGKKGEDDMQSCNMQAGRQAAGIRIFHLNPFSSDKKSRKPLLYFLHRLFCARPDVYYKLVVYVLTFLGSSRSGPG